MTEKIETIVSLVETEIPDFVDGIKAMKEKNGTELIIHQDAFGADYQHDEMILLGSAIKYAGIHGITITITGTNRETLNKKKKS